MNEEKTLDELRATGVRRVRVVDEEELKESVFRRLLKSIFGEKIPPNVELMEKLYEEARQTNELLRDMRDWQRQSQPPAAWPITATGTGEDPWAGRMTNITVTLDDDTEVTSTLDNVTVEETKGQGTGSAAKALKKLKEGQ